MLACTATATLPAPSTAFSAFWIFAAKTVGADDQVMLAVCELCVLGEVLGKASVVPAPPFHAKVACGGGTAEGSELTAPKD